MYQEAIQANFPLNANRAGLNWISFKINIKNKPILNVPLKQLQEWLFANCDHRINLYVHYFG